MSYLSSSEIRRRGDDKVNMMYTYAKPGELPQFYTIFDVYGTGAASYEAVCELVEQNPDATIEEIREAVNFDPADAARKRLGITINDLGDFVFHDEDGSAYELPNSFGEYFDTISEKDTEEIEAVRAFARRLSKNPKEYARLAIADWVAKNPSISILSDGRIVGYRGLRSDFTAIHPGFGYVNGEPQAHDGHLDNSPGNVLSFPTELIDHDPSKACSFGLHFGTFVYADGYARNCNQSGTGVRVSVAVAPEDVVSSPLDSHESKLRTLSFEVIEQVAAPYTETVIL